MKKRKVIIFLVVIFAFIILVLLGGLKKRTDVTLIDYSVIEEGKKMKLYVEITSSTGYLRNLKVKQVGDNEYITFYSTFGFFNSKFGAKNEYEIKLNQSCNQIYFYKGDGEYELFLQKDEITNEWKIVK